MGGGGTKLLLVFNCMYEMRNIRTIARWDSFNCKNIEKFYIRIPS